MTPVQKLVKAVGQAAACIEDLAAQRGGWAYEEVISDLREALAAFRAAEEAPAKDKVDEIARMIDPQAFVPTQHPNDPQCAMAKQSAQSEAFKKARAILSAISPSASARDEDKARILICEGVGGLAIYINNLRVTPRSTKPLGGGKTIVAYTVDANDIRDALSRGFPKS